MSRFALPLIAAVLLLLAVGGVVAGFQTIAANKARQAAEDAAADARRAAAAARGESPPPDAPADSAPGDAQPPSLIRFGIPEAPPRNQGAIRLATYNAENLFDAIDDPALSGREEDIDDAKPEGELAALAAAIRALDADILALQEIESEAVIRWFRESYLADLGYDHLASIDAGDERGIEQAVLSRFPITDVANWPGKPLGGTHPEQWGDAENYNAGEPITFHRSPLRVRVEVPSDVTGGPAYDLTLFIVHAKSGGPGEYWREAEAAGLVEILAEETRADPHANIAVVGDFNALLTDPSLQALTGAGLADALADVYQRGPRFVTHESSRRIDHILVNTNLATEIVPSSGFVLGTPALPEGMDWRDEWRPEGYASDHYPVAVEIRPAEVEPMTPETPQNGATGG